MDHLPLAQLMSTDAAGGAALLMFLLYLPMAYAVINVAFMLWLWPDARARGIQKPIGWMVGMFFLGPIALAFYLGSRPHGRLRQCPHCGEECLETENTCPHCSWSFVHQTAPDQARTASDRGKPLAHA
jgi:hypothetical protein